FILAVQNRDLHFLTQLPGIGKKGAERLLLELKDKFGKNMGDVQYTVSVSEAMPEGAVTEAVEALASLGYARAEIMPVLKKIKDVEKLSGEEILRQALKLFVRR
ncbi:MAG: helix-hairpin-helix domain-containing protein, partial [Clostridia bacterium]|nr:helix-hairpin-helix domain-containing protein [Clostridia bacterium]